MPGLLFTQQVTATANVEIMAGQRESGTKRIEGMQDLQPALGLRCDTRVRRSGQIGIGARLGAPDPAPQLIQL